MNLIESLNNIKTLKEAYEAKSKSGQTPEISLKTIEAAEKTLKNMYGDYSLGKISIKEAIQTTDTLKLIPKVVEGKLREAAEPEYLGTKFMTKVTVDGTNTTIYELPVVGEITATEVGEGSRYNEDYVDTNVLENSTLAIKVRKIGVKVSITEEAISDSSWDLLSLNIRKMGQAMARYKEELVFNNFTAHGHVIFNNELRAQMPEAGTTGLGKDGTLNDTLTVEDMLDMVLALMGNGFVPTDIIMHPLTWVIFARNSMIGNGLTFGAFGGNEVHPWGATQGTPGFAGLSGNGNGQKLIMRPEQVQNRLPVPLNINFSPFVNFDKVNKRFDMYCIDRSEVGIIAQREELSTEEWRDPEKDIKCLKAKERYGVGILNNGRAITVARNLAVDTTYPAPPVVEIKQK